MQSEERDYVEVLLTLAQGQGGCSLAVIGDSNASGLYWAGTRYKPLKTLLEAVLRCIMAGTYDRVLAFTGQNRQSNNHLPQWKLADGFHLGIDEMIWVVKGESEIQPTTLPPENKRRTWERKNIPIPLLSQRIIWRAQGSEYWDRLERFLKYRDEEIEKAKSGNMRTALIVDFNFLMPNAREAGERHSFFNIQSRRAHTIASGFPVNLQGAQVDLILFAEDGLALDMLQPSSLVITQTLARHMHEQEWKQYELQLQATIPRLYMGEDTKVILASRAPSPVCSRRLEIQQEHTTSALYEQLRFSVLNRRPSVAAPPLRPNEVALEFWANIDLSHLKATLDEEIIGQAEAKQTVCRVLEDHKKKCADFLTRNGYARKTIDEWFRLPVIGLFGAAGMGKTSFCKVLVKSLFDDEQYGRLIELAGKNINVATVGVAPPWAGYEQESDIVNFARNTGGLGVVCFDEFTRILPSSNTRTLADDLGSLLQLLQDCKIEPANPVHRPPGRFFYFANTLFVFSGNVSPPGESPPEGFHSIDSLGPAFKDRVSKPVFFTALNPSDYREAAQRALRRAARKWAEFNLLSGSGLTSESLIIEEELIDYVERTYRASIERTAGTPSMRSLDHIIKVLDFGKAFDSALVEGRDKVILGIGIVTGG